MPASRRAVHPRMRGEHIASCAVAAHFVGSSPHARGTPQIDVPHAGVSWFIPACAGNTACPALVPWRAPVHPRMRGEHARPFAGFSVRAGSSPHARGTHQIVCRCTLDKRFIPACAGNTTTSLKQPSTLAVHPRMRGEHTAGGTHLAQDIGSSPHARGTLLLWVAL